MGKKLPLPDMDPLALPVGTCVGPWRVLGWGGRGSYGTIYRVERVGREWEGTFALKLAIYPDDERFEREAWLLSHIDSPHVPRLYEHGVWKHRRGAFPYLVMEWVEGESLYLWFARHNPTRRQAVEKLMQVARALEATHAVGAVHRDVKGDNIWVRVDGRVFLMDFGAGHYRGAATLTTRLMPPSTPAYRSPEAWGFWRVFRHHPTAHYPASATDDLFALGVTAYRLVTDEYPQATDPEEPGAEVWREDGPGPTKPSELNPRVSPELEALLLRLLAIAPNQRFGSRARGAVEALEQLAQKLGPEDELPLFPWPHEHRPGVRSPSGVQMAKEWDAAVRVVRGAHPGEVMQAAPGQSSREGGDVAVGESAKRAPATPQPPESQEASVSQPGDPLPEKPLPGQKKPPCNANGEVEIRGGCWTRIGEARPPCMAYAYEWKGGCYQPVLSSQRQPAADP
jgi:eukaryotic-like serine/threonine-protein kinase